MIILLSFSPHDIITISSLLFSLWCCTLSDSVKSNVLVIVRQSLL